MIEDPVRDDANVLAVSSFKGLKQDLIDVDGNVEPVTKEEEIVTKKKTELTTTKQIETRVKRQVVLEDGKVVEDSGPIIETNTTEDTNKQESESVERRNVGGDEVDGPRAIEHFPFDSNQPISAYIDATSGDKHVIAAEKVLAPRDDGLVREMKTRKVVSREQIQERTETEDVKHLGDFSDEAYVDAVNRGVENIQEALLSPSAQKQLVATGPRIVHHSTRARKTIDTEDTDLKCLAQADGTLVTEKHQTTEHEEFIDDELPEKDDNSTGSRERIEHNHSTQRFSKRRDEQEIEYVADGKTIGKEMKYLAETEDIERDGPQEDVDDWDSLSDRVRKARKQKTLLQQHREALMKKAPRAIDFEKEEETRKDETIKWLENHFGSDGRSPSTSTEDESEKKKSFFNVTIKTNPTAPRQNPPSGPSKLTNGTHQEASKPQKYFQGISEWSERKNEATARKFATKTFHDELKGTLERNRLRSMSRENLVPTRYSEDRVKSDEDTRKPTFKSDARYGSRADLKTQKEDLGYLSGSRTDVRHRHDSKEELYAKSKKQPKNYLHREDSGYVKDSSEDVRFIKNAPIREDSFIRDSGEEEKPFKEPIKYTNTAIQRDDSAYVSSSTYFTEPRSPKTVPLCTPDSGIRSPTPETFEAEMVKPVVPQRKRDRKMMRTIENSHEAITKKATEPPPDYPQNRSRSVSPTPSPTTHYRGNPKKMYQKTRFASSSELSRPAQTKTTTQTIETQTPREKKKTNVGASITNSIRKLVGKIRSASVDRKAKSKAKRAQSPSSNAKQSMLKHTPYTQMGNGSTYQQYNVIDNHIGQSSLTNGSTSNREPSVASNRRERTPDQHQYHQQHPQPQQQQQQQHQQRHTTADINGMAHHTNHGDKPKYYLGEDPYYSMYGKENKYDGSNRAQKYLSRRQRSEDVDAYNGHRQSSANTLGRFSKSTNRLQTSPSQLDYDYRSAQTLPRKLEHKPMHSSAINVAIVNNARSPSSSASPAPPQGPAKPARTYKSINRSKSFNVHGMNGTNDPSPIYLSKLNRNINHHPLYRSNPHLAEDKPQLRSPSIVNLISRSQRDLSKIDEVSDLRRNGFNNQPRHHSPMHYTKHVGPHDRRAQSLMRTTSDNYRTEFDQRTAYKYGLDRNYQRERESSLGSRSPITINKDTAAIIRRNNSDSSGEDYTGAPKPDGYHLPINGKGASRYRSGDVYTRYATDRRNSASPVILEVRGRK